MDGYEFKHSYRKPDDIDTVLHQKILVCQNRRWLKVKELAETLLGHAFVYAEATFSDAARKYEEIPNQLFVVKQSSKRLVQSGFSRSGQRILEDIQEEIRILQEVITERSEFVTHAAAFFSDQYNFYSFFPFCNRGDLFDYIGANCRQHLTESEAARIMFDIMRGVAHIHRFNVVHLDISPENVVLHRDPVTGAERAVIIDFGVAREMSNGKIRTAQAVGKSRYMAPEMHNSRADILGRPCDIWTLGSTLFVMLFGAPLYESPAPSSATFTLLILQRKFRQVLQQWQFHPSPEALDFLMSILDLDPTRRPSLDSLFQHPFITSNVQMQSSSTPGAVDSLTNIESAPMELEAVSVSVSGAASISE